MAASSGCFVVNEDAKFTTNNLVHHNKSSSVSYAKGEGSKRLKGLDLREGWV